ncbi:hypothetical protein ACH4E8_07675 [Streptomyces sp. NPDC017979]|uniref:hypothetical protein n=1 Tax=Streptomyces sp. NPDC017979 TaxID=3365024 RepID=UPI0037AABD8F
MTQKNTNTSAGEFITSRGAAQVAPATAFEGTSPRERHSPAPPAPPTSAAAAAEQGEPASPTTPTVPTTPPVTPADAQVDTATDAPAEGGATTVDTDSTPSTGTGLEDEIVIMERHSPMPPPPRD